MHLDRILSGQKVVVRIYAIGPEPKNIKSVFTEVSAFATADAVTSVIGGGTTENLPPDAEEVTLEPVGKDQVIMRWSPTANGQSLDEFVAVIRHSGKVDGSGEWYKSNLLRKFWISMEEMVHWAFIAREWIHTSEKPFL